MIDETNQELFEDRIVREKERRCLTGIPYTTWLKYERLGEVPKGQRLVGNTKGWKLSDLQAWINEKFTKEQKEAA